MAQGSQILPCGPYPSPPATGVQALSSSLSPFICTPQTLPSPLASNCLVIMQDMSPSALCVVSV